MPKKLSPLYAAAAALTILLAACGGSAPQYKEKTPQERKESFHRDLVTDDLRLFGLRGAVKTVNADNTRMAFMPNGMLESVVYCGDSLAIVRNNEGAILRLLDTSGQEIPLSEITRAAAKNRHTDYW